MAANELKKANDNNKEAKQNKEAFPFFWKPEDENGCFSQWYLQLKELPIAAVSSI